MPHLERSVQPSSKTLIHSGRPPRSDLHVVPQHEFLGIRMEIDLLVHPLRHRVAVQVMLQERQRHDQRRQPPPVVLDEAQELPTDQR
jgi:hypothetical protein